VTVKFRISRQRLEALITLYEWMMDTFIPSTLNDGLDFLLKAHLEEMYFMLTLAEPKCAKGTTLHLTEPQALAFCLFWGSWKIEDPLANVAVCDIIGLIDKQAKNSAYAIKK